MKTNKKQGVSLMTLIITIVVMSILTGTIIISITNSNTIDNAKDAVKRYTLAEVNQFANVAYGEAVMDKLTNQEEILKFIKAELKEYGIDIAYYKISLNGNKVTVENRDTEPWKFKKDNTGKYEYVTNKDITLATGDYVNYDETKGGTIAGLTDVEWRVMGATEEGDLMLMASDGVKKADVNYNEAVEIPNKISREYGYGKGAVYARSITIQDVNYLTGYNPNNVGVYDPEQTGNGTKYAQGEMWEYSNKVTYHWIRSESLTYKYTTPDGILKTKTIDISNIQSNLTHVFFVMDKYEEEPAIYDDDQIIVTIKNTSFSYNMSDYISKDSNVYKLLARDSANTSYRSYCCASPSVDTDELGANFGIFEIENGNIYRGSSVSSNGDIDPYGTWICPIVILDSNVELDKVTNGVWNIK